MSKVNWDKAPDGTERYREQGVRPWLRKVDGRVEYYDTDTQRWTLYLHDRVGIEHWNRATARPEATPPTSKVDWDNAHKDATHAITTGPKWIYGQESAGTVEFITMSPSGEFREAGKLDDVYVKGDEAWVILEKRPSRFDVGAHVSDVNRVGVMSDVGAPVSDVSATPPTTKRRYYIAGPITGYESTYRDVFNAMSDTLSAQGHVILNPATLPAGLTQGQYMDICTAMLRCVTHVKMLKGWERSEGARIEHALAIKSDLTVEYE